MTARSGYSGPVISIRHYAAQSNGEQCEAEAWHQQSQSDLFQRGRARGGSRHRPTSSLRGLAQWNDTLDSDRETLHSAEICHPGMVEERASLRRRELMGAVGRCTKAHNTGFAARFSLSALSG